MLFAYELDQLGPGSPCSKADAGRTGRTEPPPNRLRLLLPRCEAAPPGCRHVIWGGKARGQQASRSATGVTGLVPRLAALDLGWHTRKTAVWQLTRQHLHSVHWPASVCVGASSTVCVSSGICTEGRSRAHLNSMVLPGPAGLH